MLKKNLLCNKLRNIFKNKEFNNASWLILGRIIQIVVGFIVSIFTARYLGSNNYGVINYASAFVAFFTSICTLGINSIIIKDFVDDPLHQGEAIGTSLFLRIIASTISLLMITSIVYLLDSKDEATVEVAFLCSISMIFQAFDTFNYWFQSRYESKYISIVTLIAYFCTMFYKIAILVFDKDIKWFALSSTLDYIVYAIIIYKVYTMRGGPCLSFSISKAYMLLSKSYHYIISGVMVAVYAHTDSIMLKHMLNTSAVGNYGLAVTLNNVWVFVLGAIIDSIYPSIYKSYKNDNLIFDRKNRQLYALIIYLSLFVGFLILLFSDKVIPMVYGSSYNEASVLINIVCWYTVFSYLGVARNAWIVCNNLQHYLKYMYFSAAIINVFLNYYLIPELGASGAAIASLVTQFCTCILLPLFIKEMRPNVKLMYDALLLRDVI